MDVSEFTQEELEVLEGVLIDAYEKTSTVIECIKLQNLEETIKRNLIEANILRLESINSSRDKISNVLKSIIRKI